MEAEERPVQLELQDTHVDLVAPECVIRFKSRDAFLRFREWVETARIVGDERARPIQTPTTNGPREEWYVLAMGDGNVALHHFSESEIDWTILLTEERWREIGHVVLASSADVP